MNDVLKNILIETCHLFQSLCDILTFGATVSRRCETKRLGETNLHASQRKLKAVSNAVNNRFNAPFFEHRHNKILKDLQMFANDFRALCASGNETFSSANLSEKNVLIINNRPAVINWRTHTIRIRQRD